MSLKTLSLQNILNEYAKLYNVKYSVVDNDGTSICNTGSYAGGVEKHNLYRLQEQEYAAKTIRLGGVPVGQLMISGPKHKLDDALTSANIAIEALLASMREPSNKWSREDYGSKMVDLLLSNTQNHKDILGLMHDADFDEALMRSSICIEIDYKINSYFNINLNLGYVSAIEKLRGEIENRIRSNKYLNTQDFWGWHGNKTIIISKSFIKNSDLFRVYQAMDKICQSMESDLATYKLLNMKIAYGNIYDDILDVKRSYFEAMEILSLGKIRDASAGFYNVDTVMLDIICCNLHQQILNKIILPVKDKLTSHDGNFQSDLLLCAEAFIDKCMDYTLAAEALFIHRNTLKKKMTRLTEVTGLDPAKDFSHATIIKLVSVFVRQRFIENDRQAGTRENG